MPCREPCFYCDDLQVVDEPVCHLCECNEPHSSCDDSYYIVIECPVCQEEDERIDNAN
jgi:hypothetical protein